MFPSEIKKNTLFSYYDVIRWRASWILDIFAIFGGKRLVTLAVSVLGHHKMAQMKGEVVLISTDTLIMF